MKTTKRRTSILAFITMAVMLLTFLPVPAAVAAEYTATLGAQFDPTVNAEVGEWPDLSGSAVTFTPGEETTITLEFDAPVKMTGNFIGIDTDMSYGSGSGSIVSVKADGRDIAVNNDQSYGSKDDAGETVRLTLALMWGAEIQSVDAEEIGEFQKLEVVFVLNEAAAYTATLGAQFDTTVNEAVGEWPDLSASAVPFTPGEEATITLEFDAPVKMSGNFIGIDTDMPYGDGSGSGSIVAVKADGRDIAVNNDQSYGSKDDAGETARLALALMWGAEIKSVDVEEIGEFQKLEVTFVLNTDGGTPPAEEPVPAGPAFDPNGTYHAYLGIQQDVTWIFRDPWGSPTLGASGSTWDEVGTNNFNGLSKIDSGELTTFSGDFTDVEIKGNGTYRVELNNADFTADSMLNLLFVSTDIPVGDGTAPVFSNINVYVGGSKKHTFDEAITDPDSKAYISVLCINKWNTDLGGDDGLFPCVMPQSSFAIEFTVSGFAYDNEAAAQTETPAPSPEVTTPSDDATEDDNGGFPVWAIILIAVAGVAIIIGIIVAVSKKK